MRVLLAPQEFKGSLTALEAISALAMGVERVLPDADLDRLPLADGGPGTVNAMVVGVGGRYALSSVDGPLGEPVSARWALIDDGRSALIEMAAASGLHLVPADRLDARRASSSGTGELIRAALDAGVARILVGIGGSATNDGGAGMAAVLGVRFLDDDGRPLPPGGAALARLARLDDSALDPRLARVEVVALADVRNPPLRPRGAPAPSTGPRRGRTPPPSPSSSGRSTTTPPSSSGTAASPSATCTARAQAAASSRAWSPSRTPASNPACASSRRRWRWNVMLRRRS